MIKLSDSHITGIISSAAFTLQITYKTINPVGGQVSWIIPEGKKKSFSASLSLSLCQLRADGVRAVSGKRCVNDLFAVHFDCTFGTFSGCHSNLLRELLWCLANWSQFRPADSHIVVYVLSKTYKALRLTVLDCTNYTKDGAFLCCDAARPLQVLTIHDSLSQRRAWSYGYGVCISLCIKPAVLIHEHLKFAPHESCSAWDSETMLSRFFGDVRWLNQPLAEISPA